MNEFSSADTLVFPGSVPNRTAGRRSAQAGLISDLQGMAASMGEVDPRAAGRLRDLAESLGSERGRQRWTDVDLRQAFNTERLAIAYAVRREGGYAPASIEMADRLRNILVLFPILLTWAALAEASAAYRRFIDRHPDQSAQPFLLLWQRGFGGEASRFAPSFSTVALIDAAIILAIILLTIYAHGRREGQEDVIASTASSVQTDLENILAEATVALASDRSSRPARLTESVERLADRFERSSQELLTQLQVEHDRLESLASRRDKEFADFGMFASGMRAGADEMHRLLVDLRQVSTSLETTLEDLTSEIGASSEQQRSLLTAVGNLERLTSSSIQSDQSATRQLAAAAVSLADASDKALSGAETAAQAGRTASEAVRGISAIANAIAESQSRVESAMSTGTEANSRLAEALRTNTSSAQATARTLNDIGAVFGRFRDEFDRIGQQSAQQGTALNNLLNQQAEIARDISTVTKELGAVGMTTAQRQREVSQDLTHLMQRLDGLANSLSRLSQQVPSTEALQQAFANALRGTATRQELSRGGTVVASDETDEPERAPGSPGFWSRTPRS
jgi:archaellum component FlaC